MIGYGRVDDVEQDLLNEIWRPKAIINNKFFDVRKLHGFCKEHTILLEYKRIYNLRKWNGLHYFKQACLCIMEKKTFVKQFLNEFDNILLTRF